MNRLRRLRMLLMLRLKLFVLKAKQKMIIQNYKNYNQNISKLLLVEIRMLLLDLKLLFSNLQIKFKLKKQKKQSLLKQNQISSLFKTRLINQARRIKSQQIRQHLQARAYLNYRHNLMVLKISCLAQKKHYLQQLLISL